MCRWVSLEKCSGESCMEVQLILWAQDLVTEIPEDNYGGGVTVPFLEEQVYLATHWGKWRQELWGSQGWGHHRQLFISEWCVLKAEDFHSTTVTELFWEEEERAFCLIKYLPHSELLVWFRFLATCTQAPLSLKGCMHSSFSHSATLQIKWLTSHWLIDVWLDSCFLSQNVPLWAVWCVCLGGGEWLFIMSKLKIRTLDSKSNGQKQYTRNSSICYYKKLRRT